jgi:hypothetical protein
MPVRYGHCGIIGASVLSALKLVAPGHRPVHGGRKMIRNIGPHA